MPTALGISTIGYNKRMVKKEEGPKGCDDLMHPKWKGSLSIDLEPERALVVGSLPGANKRSGR